MRILFLGNTLFFKKSGFITLVKNRIIIYGKIGKGANPSPFAKGMLSANSPSLMCVSRRIRLSA